METKNELVAGGYRFATVADAEAARVEEKKIASVEQHLDYRKPQNVLQVYNKAIDNRVFLTPVGLSYLRQMRARLIKCGVPEDKIRPVPLYATFSNKTENNRSVRLGIAAGRPQPVEFRGRFIVSVCVNVLLVLAIAAMIVLSLGSDVPNIVNYRTAVVNEYSEWEQELHQREQRVREAEKALNLTP